MENLIEKKLSERDWKSIIGALIGHSVTVTSECLTCKDVMSKERFNKDMEESKRLVYLVNVLDGKKEYSLLSDAEKIELINSMGITEDSASSGEMEYVLVDDNEKNRGILHKIGLTDKEIEDKCCPEDGELDILIIGFEYADSYDFKKKYSITGKKN